MFQALFASQMRHHGRYGGGMASRLYPSGGLAVPSGGCADYPGENWPLNSSSDSGVECSDGHGGEAGWMWSLLGVFGNDFFVGGFLLMLAQSLLQVVAAWAAEGWRRFKERFQFSASVDETDITFEWFLDWLAEHEYARSARSTTIRSSWSRGNSYAAMGGGGFGHGHGARAGGGQVAKGHGRRKPSITLIPAFGSHVVRFQNKWVVVSRVDDEGAAFSAAMPQRLTGGGQPVGPKPKKIVLRVFGRDGRRTIDELIALVIDQHASKYQGHTEIYSSNARFGGSCNWFPLCTKEKRPFESVIMKTGLAESIRGDVARFLDSEDWYRQTGVPYRRGFILSGPPGTGKTSFLLALAGELDLSLCVINLSKPGLGDDGLIQLFSTAPSDSIILVEDVDAAFRKLGETDNSSSGTNANREKGEDDRDSSSGQPEDLPKPRGKGRSAQRGRMKLDGMDQTGEGITFSGLLNAIDGVASQEGRLLFMTTNHIEQLPPALIRPGRVDRRWVIDLADSDQIYRMFIKFFPDEADAATAVAKAIGNQRVSPAALQGFFMQFRENPRDCIDRVAQFLDGEGVKQVDPRTED